MKRDRHGSLTRPIQRPSDSGLDSDGLFITGSAAAHIPYSGGRTQVYFLATGVAALF